MLEYLRLLTMDVNSNPWPDFQVEHECRNFDKLVAWTDSRKATTNGETLVNPYFRESHTID